MPEQLSDFDLPNGLGYTAREPQRVYDLRYRDPDADDVSFDLTFTAIMDPLHTKTSGPDGGHLDQLGRFTGTLVLDGETIEVDSYGARDRSWGSRNPSARTSCRRVSGRRRRCRTATPPPTPCRSSPSPRTSPTTSR